MARIANTKKILKEIFNFIHKIEKMSYNIIGNIYTFLYLQKQEKDVAL